MKTWLQALVASTCIMVLSFCVIVATKISMQVEAAPRPPYFSIDSVTGAVTIKALNETPVQIGSIVKINGVQTWVPIISVASINAALGPLGGALAGSFPNPQLSSGAVIANIGTITGALKGSVLPLTTIAPGYITPAMVNSSNVVTCAAGSPSASFQVNNGLVIHC